MDTGWWDSRTWQKDQDCQHNNPRKRVIAPTKAKTWCKISVFPSDCNITWNLMRTVKALEVPIKSKSKFPSSNYQCHKFFGHACGS